MLWDFAETNPFSNSTKNWADQVELVAKAVEHLPTDTSGSIVRQSNAATTIGANDGIVIVTDPPYYANIGYADLSDFFYVWLRPVLRSIYPDLFTGILTPKDDEIVAAPRFDVANKRFEDMLEKALTLIREHCSPDFPSSIFYAYKQQEEEHAGKVSTGWETMLSALVTAGFQIVGTCPMRTERSNRLRSHGSNALASSVVLVCRPRPESAPTATRRQFLDALEAELPKALDQLTHEGHIAPVDLAQAAIGPGMQVYSRYRRVETISGERVTVREALAAINQVIAEYDER